jgi:cytidylate kinase
MASGKVASETYRLLADRQMRRWEMQHRTGAQARRPPCVAISRLPGAGGAEIGRRAAEALDYGFFGREVVDEIGRERGLDHWLIAGLDERVRTAIDRFVGDAFSRRHFRESDYLRDVTRAVATLGRRGSAVIVGRGAAFTLSPEEALRVLLVAPRSVRLERYAAVRELPADRAEQVLARAEEQRSEFVQKQFGVRQDDPLLYDLVLNTATLGFEHAAQMIVETLRRRFP